MHDVIYQITSTPVSKEDYITESYFYEHWFLNSVADSVNEQLDRDESISGLKEWLEHFGSCKFDEKTASFTLHTGFQEAYFKDKFAEFQKNLQQLEKVSLQEFCHNNSLVDGLLFKLQSTLADKFRSYVSSEEFETVTLDEFIRSAQMNKTYFIGGVLDYHC